MIGDLKMALTRVLKTLDGLAADVAKEYKEVDGQFVLDITGDDLQPLINAKNHVKEELATTKTKLAKAEQDLLDIRKGVIPKEDLEAIENSYKQKLTDAETAKTASEKTLTKRLNQATIKAQAQAIAASMSDAPHLMLPYIERRLSVEFDDNDTAIIRVKGADGKASALTLDDLKKELVANPELAPIIRGSKGTGGGANATTTNPSNPGGAGKKLKDMSEKERVDLFRSNRAEFDRLVAEQNAPSQ